MGDGWYAQAMYDEFRIHAIYSESDKAIGEHEDTHLLSLPWGLSVHMLQEGLAEHMVGHAWDGTPHTQYVKEGYAQALYPELGTFMDPEAWGKTHDEHALSYYSLAGAFTSFLVETFGMERFKLLYKKTSRSNTKEENSAAFKEIYDENLEVMEKRFKEWIL